MIYTTFIAESNHNISWVSQQTLVECLYMKFPLLKNFETKGKTTFDSLVWYSWYPPLYGTVELLSTAGLEQEVSGSQQTMSRVTSKVVLDSTCMQNKIKGEVLCNFHKHMYILVEWISYLLVMGFTSRFSIKCSFTYIAPRRLPNRTRCSLSKSENWLKNKKRYMILHVHLLIYM